MKYDIKRTFQFKNDFKLVIKIGVEIKEFEKVIALLANGDAIPEKYRDHLL